MRLKHYLIFLTFLFFFSSAQSQTDNDVWQMSFTTVDHFNMNMNFCKGRQIVIYIFDSSNFNTDNIRFFDSLNRKMIGYGQVIGIPVGSSSISMPNVLNLINKMGVSFPIADNSNDNFLSTKNSLFSWLMTSSKKNHFKVGTILAGETFVISSSGVLYAVLHSNVLNDRKELDEILHKEATE